MQKMQLFICILFMIRHQMITQLPTFQFKIACSPLLAFVGVVIENSMIHSARLAQFLAQQSTLNPLNGIELYRLAY